MVLVGLFCVGTALGCILWRPVVRPACDVVATLLSRPLCEVLVLVLIVFGAVHYAGSKPDGGQSQMSPRSGESAQQRSLSAPDMGDLGGGDGFGVLPAVSNLTIAAVLREMGITGLVVAWPPTIRPEGDIVEVYGATNLHNFVKVKSVDVSGCASNALVAVSDVEVSGVATNSAEFLAVGDVADTDNDGVPDAEERLVRHTDPSLPDSDGDGLTDGEEVAMGTDPVSSDTDGDGLGDRLETGCIKVLPTFEWHDTSAFAYRVYDSSSGGGFSGYFGLYVIADISAFSLSGIACNSLLAFDDGYVSLSAVGDSYMWAYPYWSYPLSVDGYNAGTFLVAPYGIGSALRQNDTNSYMCVGIVADGESLVLEYRNIVVSGSNGAAMTYQVIVPSMTGDVVRVSYLSSDLWMDGSGGAVVGVHNRRIRTSDGVYNLTWDFSARGPILPQTTVEYRFGRGTLPLVVDTDSDGLADGYEVTTTGTDPVKADTDGDGLFDGEELVIGTDPVLADTDGDGLPAGWEAENNLNPLSAVGDDGAPGDPDGDLLDNAAEYSLETDPQSVDTDGDGLADYEETVLLSYLDPIPWLQLQDATNLTLSLNNSSKGICVDLPVPLEMQGKSVTSVTLGKRGMLLFNRPGYGRPDLLRTDWPVGSDVLDPNCLAVVPYDGPFSLNYKPVDPPTVRIGMSEYGGRGYVVVEYADVTYSTNSMSFQVAVPTGRVDRVGVRYAGNLGENFNGWRGHVGYQTFGGRDIFAYCSHEFGKIYDGLALSFVFGMGTDPVSPDTDGDGLTDYEEMELGMDPTSVDSDGDGLHDDWEVENGLNPLSAVGDDGANGDGDGDGLVNIHEQTADCDPNSADTDGDGVSDFSEIMNGANPSDGSDGGRSSASYPYRGLTFNVYGDYAAWLMTIEGIGPFDRQVDMVSMSSPDVSNEKLKILRKGNSYRLSMEWLNSEGHEDPCWYCWQAKINGLPTAPSYQSYTTTRLEGNEIVHGLGWMAENESGLLTSHVHSYDGAGGNIAGSLQTILHLYQCEVSICNPDDDAWGELEASRVLLEGENLRVRVKISPAIETLELCRLVMGSNLCVKTTGTCPDGVDIPVAAADFTVYTDHSEIRVTKTFAQLKTLGLLPSQDEDGIDEMAVYDVGSIAGIDGSNLSDSSAFLALGAAERGVATGESSQMLTSDPPRASLSESFLKAAGCEIMAVTYGGVESNKRQIMNQADILYYSGHGLHKFALLDDYGPSVFTNWWNRDLNCLVVSGCSILDVNDYNNNFALDPEDHMASPGKLWENVGPNVMLGYNYYAPADDGGVPARVAHTWVTRRGLLGEVDAWMEANAVNRAWNACAIVKGQKYVYFEKVLWGFMKRKKEIQKEDW